MADLLAREAAGSNRAVPDRPIPRYPSYYRQAFKDLLFQKCKTKCETADPKFARQTKLWFLEPSFRKSRKILAHPRDIISRVDRQCFPEAPELQGGLVGDADECVPLLLAPPGEGGPHHAEVREAHALQHEGGVLRSLGLEQDSARVGSEPGAQSFWLAQKS